MKKLESSLLNMVLVLTGVAVIMGGIPSGAFAPTPMCTLRLAKL